MSGAEFQDTLEAGFRGEGPSKGYFPQVSGFRVCVDHRRAEGQRIVQLQVPAAEGGFAEIDDGTDYRVVAPDFLPAAATGISFRKRASGVCRARVEVPPCRRARSGGR